MKADKPLTPIEIAWEKAKNKLHDGHTHPNSRVWDAERIMDEAIVAHKAEQDETQKENKKMFELLEMVARGIHLNCDSEDVIRITSDVKKFCIAKREALNKIQGGVGECAPDVEKTVTDTPESVLDNPAMTWDELVDRAKQYDFRQECYQSGTRVLVRRGKEEAEQLVVNHNGYIYKVFCVDQERLEWKYFYFGRMEYTPAQIWRIIEALFGQAEVGK